MRIKDTQGPSIKSGTSISLTVLNFSHSLLRGHFDVCDKGHG